MIYDCKDMLFFGKYKSFRLFFTLQQNSLLREKQAIVALMNRVSEIISN